MYPQKYVNIFVYVYGYLYIKWRVAIEKLNKLERNKISFRKKQRQTANMYPQKSVNIFVYVYRYLYIKWLVAIQKRNKLERNKNSFRKNTTSDSQKHWQLLYAKPSHVTKP